MARKTAQLALAGVPRVNLLPRAETDRRARLSLTRAWSFGALVAIIVVVLLIAGTIFLRFAAERTLAAEQARTATLTTELTGYAEVSRTIAGAATLEAFRAEAMGSDFEWAPVIADVTRAMPTGVLLTGFVLAPGATPTGEDPTLEAGAFGVLTFTSATTAEQAQTVSALAAVASVQSADAGAMYSAGEGIYEFIVNVTFDQTIYSGAFSAEGSE